MTASRSILIVGAGEFGLTAALELRRRGWVVSVLDPGPLPRDTAASTDISKVVRMDYGADEQHTALGEAAITGWQLWNRQWGEELYHEDGFLVLAQAAMPACGFEGESFRLLRERGHRLERLNAAALDTRFPVWAKGRYTDGYLNPRGGWAESGKVMARMAAMARSEGVQMLEGSQLSALIERGSKLAGLITTAGESLRADRVLIAAGAWTPTLLPELGSVMWATGQPVVHYRVPDPAAWQAPRFPVWAADIARTGWYGFPALGDGTLKIANHGPGRRVHPDEPRVVRPEELARFRAFVEESLPALAGAPIIHTRLCLYCDTFDGNFWMDHHPERPGLVIAAGDCGHAFKFAPVLGGLIADVVERRPNAFTARYAWREPKTDAVESARAR